MLPLVAQATWERYCSRHDYEAYLLASHPHFDRNFILCPLFRSDRETPLLIQELWRQSGLQDASTECRFKGVAFTSFARRVLHNFPPSWHSIGPWLLKQTMAASFEPNSKQFETDFAAWAGEAPVDLYGSASHWYSPEVTEKRKTSACKTGWLARQSVFRSRQRLVGES